MSGTLFKLLVFTEEDPESKNPSRFLKQLDYSFAPLALQYTSEGLKIDTAKAFFLQSNTSKTAQRWIEERGDEKKSKRPLEKYF